MEHLRELDQMAIQRIRELKQQLLDKIGDDYPKIEHFTEENQKYQTLIMREYPNFREYVAYNILMGHTLTGTEIAVDFEKPEYSVETYLINLIGTI